MKRLVIGILTVLMLIGCGQSYEETKRLSRQQRLQLAREDSAALKIAVMPTLDCLPVFVAKEYHLFDSVVDIRLKRFAAQMDCDTALLRGRVEGAFTDLVRAERMIKGGMPLRYVSSTNAYWLLIGNRQSRVTQLKHLDDKMLAMTRYSATDLLGDLAVDSARLKSERVFRIQVNDVNIRLKMLENNVMDALLLTEPQATQALLAKHKVLLDTRKLDFHLGVVAFRTEGMDHSKRKQQIEAFMKGYRAACDSINRMGIGHYKNIIKKYYGISNQTLKALPDTLKYTYAFPRQKDIEIVREWLHKKQL